MMTRYTKGNYKVVEINNMTALRSGQMAAQSPALKTDFPGADVLENGWILGYKPVKVDGVDVLGLAPYTEGDAIFLHYTEELFLGDSIQLNTFAVNFDNEGIAYPRALALNIGDVFTTNNVAGDISKPGYFNVVDGLLTAVESPEGHAFYGVPTYLPDGETPAVEFTYVGVIL